MTALHTNSGLCGPSELGLAAEGVCHGGGVFSPLHIGRLPEPLMFDASQTNLPGRTVDPARPGLLGGAA